MRMLWYWPFARPEELDWARAIARLGHKVTIAVVDRDGAPTQLDTDEAIGVEVASVLPEVDRSVASGARWIWSRGWSYLKRARIRRRLVDDGEFDLVHYHYINRFTDPWCRPPGLWIISVHDVLPHQPRIGAMERRLLSHVYRRPDGLIVHHEWLRAALKSHFGISPDRVRVVPLQVCPVPESEQRSPGKGLPMVLFFGALRENKGLEVLLEALRCSGDQVRLHIAGRGTKHLEELATEAARSHANVTAEIGRVSEARKSELFRECSVVALPYTSFSSQSGVLHDAYGHGRPVVVTDVGALGSTVRTDKTGLVVPVSDADALMNALLAMCGPQGEPSAAAARRAAEQRTPTAVALSTIEAYEYFAARRA